MKQYAVIFSHANNVGLDGYEGLNANDTRRANKAVFDTRQEAKDHRDARAAANPDCRFTVVEIDT
ncbi:MAG TPA: hypothetical protein VHH11_03815 [Gammaproteobacteria bacterium]|nr:hypothetical protein [Gammaproteobacteria bacterium]